MKQTFYFLTFFIFGLVSTAWAQPANDNCSGATSLGTLIAPPACGNATTGTKKSPIDSIFGTSAGATPSNPYPYITTCAPNLTSPPDDVWYSFVASSEEITIAIKNATFANPAITIWEGACNSLNGLGCVAGTANAATLTLYSFTPGRTYYIQIAGADSTQHGTFLLTLTGINNCANCVLGYVATASPPPVNGTYAPGTTVTFCDSIYNFDETNSNWLHGLTPTFGAGWNLATLVPGTPPASCSTGGTWSWYPGGDTSSHNAAYIFGAGFYYETASGNTNFVLNNDPGDNFGDDNSGNNCPRKFCVTITSNNNCTSSNNLDVQLRVSSDYQSGSYTSAGCAADPIVDFYAVSTGGGGGSSSQTLGCISLPGGSVKLTASGTGTWSAAAANPGTATIISPTTDSTTITNFSIAGTYTFIYNNASCPDTFAIVVTGKPNAGPDQTLNCATLPGGTVTMAATGTGTWSPAAGNPGTATITTPTSPTTTITSFSVAGIYNFIYTNGTCSDTATVTITAKPNAGLDQTVSCAILPGGSATLAATGAGAWSAAAGNPGTATITTPTSPATTITNFSVAGTYDFIYTNGSCSDTAAVTVTAKPNAGPDQTASCVALPGGSVTMAATGIGTWSAETGNPGTAIITAPSSPTTTITTFSAPGIYSFIWTSGSCTDTATVTITSGPNAGPDQSVSCVALPGGSVTMAATGAGTWSASPGNPGTAIITNPASPTTTITTFSVTGTYLFIYSNGACSDTAIVTVSSGADAGPDQIVACTVLPGGTATMAATGMGIWTAQTGNPGTAIITTPTSPTTTITNFSAPGIYYFIWTTGSCSDTASVTVTPEPDAGPDQTVSCAILPGGTATMAATGLGIWTDAGNNPGTSTITTIFSPTTTITDFSVAGTYYYVFTNGLCSDTAAVIVTAKPDAGPDLTVPCTTLPGGTATMDAVGVGIWTAAAANPGTAVITAPGSPTTTITNFSTSGIYSFIWTVGTCSDTATITVNAQPDAGPDQTVGCAILPGGSATMAAIGTGTWSAWPNNPGTAIITNPNSPTTTITTFSVAGTYEFIYTNGICTDTALVIVSSGVNAGPDQTVSCVILPGGVATMAATGTGLWTELTGNPGTDVITSPTSPTTTITTFSAAGTYYFSYSNGSCADTAAVIVTAKPYAGTNVSVCQNGTATLTAAGTGTWSVLPTNPAQTTIVSPTNATTVINGFNIIGTYGYVWTVGICTDTAFVFVNAAPTITPVVANITCNNAVGSITAQTNGSSPFTYQWSDGNTTDSITTATAGTSYTVTVTDANQCTSTATASVGNLITPVNIADSLYDVTCYGYNNGKIVLYVSPAGQYTYGWSDNETTDSISGLSPGTYTVVATDSNGCHNTATYTITSPAGADTLSITPVDTLTTLGDTIQLNSNLTGMYPAITYSWTPDSGLSCNNCPNPMLVPVDTNRDVYKLVITYNNGCTATDSAIVTAKANDLIGIPTAFTPNGDGKNDTFFIPATSVKEFKMNIYDRWGQQIFSTTDVGAGWDGTFKGKGEPEEIYMYFFTIVYLDGKSVVKEGTLMLQR